MSNEQNHELPQVPIEMEGQPSTSNCAQRSANIRCTKCVKNRFHTKCSDSGDFKPINKKLIPKILKFIEADPEFNSLKDIQFTNETSNAIAFTEMKRKSYETIMQFEEDIKCFVQNCRSIFPERQEMQDTVDELMENIKEQIETIRACSTCYENLYERYTRGWAKKQCSKLHLLLWAKTQQNTYWPAKVLAVNVEENMVRIQNFGDYSCFLLPVEENNFYLYSQKRPGKANEADPILYTEAQKDVWEYINIISGKSQFNYAKSRTKFQLKKWKDHLKQQITADEQSTDSDETDKSSAPETVSSPDNSISDSESSEIQCNRNQYSMRKRYAITHSSDGLRLKIRCLERDNDKSDVANEAIEANEMDETDEADRVNAEEEAEEIETMERMKQMIGELKQDLEKITSEKMDLERANANLTDENGALKREIDSLNQKYLNDTKKLEDDKCVLKEQNAELMESHRKEKEIFDKEKTTLNEKYIELKEEFCMENKKFDDERKTLTERYDAEKKAFEEEMRILREKNATLETELDDERKKSDDNKKVMEEAFRQWKG